MPAEKRIKVMVTGPGVYYDSDKQPVPRGKIASMPEAEFLQRDAAYRKEYGLAFGYPYDANNELVVPKEDQKDLSGPIVVETKENDEDDDEVVDEDY